MNENEVKTETIYVLWCNSAVNEPSLWRAYRDKDRAYLDLDLANAISDAGDFQLDEVQVY